MRGRKPKPTKTKIRNGETRKDRINQNEPDVPSGSPDCPPHLDSLAREEWTRICGDLQSMGLLSTVHRPALASYCVAYSRWVEAEGKVKQHGMMMLTKDKSGLYQSPYLSVANRSMEQMHRWLTEFGLTPSSLGRVSATGGGTNDKEAKYLRVIG